MAGIGKTRTEADPSFKPRRSNRLDPFFSNVVLQDLRWPGIDRHLKTGAGSPEEVSDGPTESLYTRV